MNEGFLGEVRMFVGNFAPRGWILCEGQILAISQNTALFSIIGTNYGGDGRTSYAFRIYDQTRKINMIGKIDKKVFEGQ